MTPLMEAYWTGADGSIWDLLDVQSGVQLVALDGLGFPSFTQQFAASGQRDGRSYEGTRYQQSTITLVVSVGDIYPQPGQTWRRKGDSWRALDRQWHRSISPEIPGRLTIVTGSGGRRYLDLRLDQPFFPPPGRDPALLGEATYSIVLTADDDPWWVGEKISPQEFSSSGSAPQPFFGGTGGTTLFYISRSETLTRARLSNPGDRPAYPLWWVRGPFTTATIGLGDDTVSLPFTRSAGQTVYVDSFHQTIVDQNGVNLWPLMGFSDPIFAPIPPGEEMSLATNLTGSTSQSAVGVSIIPKYEGPW